MKTILICFAALCLIYSGCKKDNNDVTYHKAVVVSTKDLACSKPLLAFTEDSTAIQKLTGNKSLTYTVINLPDTFNVLNKKLYVSVSNLKPEEAFVCNTFGVNFPVLKIVAAKER